MLRRIVFLAFSMFTACADTVSILDPNSVSFISANQSTRASINSRFIPIEAGQRFPMIVLADGRKIVQLDSFVSSELILFGASTSQIFGSVLDNSLCTTGGLVSIAADHVNIETAIAGVQPVLCFNID